jgi:hypothetical protein
MSYEDLKERWERQKTYWRQRAMIQREVDALLCRLDRHTKMAAAAKYPQAMLEELQALEVQLTEGLKTFTMA